MPLKIKASTLYRKGKIIAGPFNYSQARKRPGIYKLNSHFPHGTPVLAVLKNGSAFYVSETLITEFKSIMRTRGNKYWLTSFRTPDNIVP